MKATAEIVMNAAEKPRKPAAEKGSPSGNEDEMLEEKSKCQIAKIRSAEEISRELDLRAERPKFKISALGEGGTFEKIGEYTDGTSLSLTTPSYFDSVNDGTLVERCSTCTCVNLDPVPKPSPLHNIHYRQETWVTVLVTIAAVGILASIIFAVFVLCRLCAEVVEGSQALTLFLLVVIAGLYSSVVPYSLEAQETVCQLRLHAPSLAFAGLFGLLLARSLMLATADFDGLPGHVSGLVQFLLFLFISGLQFALSLQEWLLREDAYAAMAVKGRYQVLECVHGRGSLATPLLYRMIYVSILLTLQVMLSPFIVSSKRNYREGLLFCLCSVACLVGWLGWTVSYVTLAHFFGEEWHDVCLCVGIVFIATAVLAVVYLPKVSQCLSFCRSFKNMFISSSLCME